MTREIRRRLRALETAPAVQDERGYDFSAMTDDQVSRCADLRFRHFHREELTTEELAEMEALWTLVIRRGPNPYACLSNAELDARIAAAESRLRGDRT